MGKVWEFVGILRDWCRDGVEMVWNMEIMWTWCGNGKGELKKELN